jgi:hypothetical protein
MKMNLPGFCPASFCKGADFPERGSLKVFLSCVPPRWLCGVCGFLSVWGGGSARLRVSGM